MRESVFLASVEAEGGGDYYYFLKKLYLESTISTYTNRKKLKYKKIMQNGLPKREGR